MQIDSAQLDTFAAVIGEGSFEAAARRLQITPSAVSQRIKALESGVGQVLVQRTKPTRSTEAGEAMLRLARQVSLLEVEAIAAVKGRVEGLRLPIAVNADSLNGWFLPALLAVPPELVTAFDLRQEDQDHSADLLRDGTVLAAVTADPRPVQGCRVRVLGRMRYLSIATPEFAERWLTGRPLVEALGDAPMVIFNPKDMLQHRLIRQLTRRRLEPPAHSIPAPGAFSRSIRLGLGWGMLEEEAVVDDLAAGRLVEVAKGKYVEVPLYWQHWKLESAVLDALTTAVLAAAETGLRTPGHGK